MTISVRANFDFSRSLVLWKTVKPLRIVNEDRLALMRLGPVEKDSQQMSRIRRRAFWARMWPVGAPNEILRIGGN